MADNPPRNITSFKAEKFSLLARKAELLEEIEQIDRRLLLVRGVIQGAELTEAPRQDG